jgi:chromosome segregation ATPase
VAPLKNALVAVVALKLETEIANAVILQIVQVARQLQLKRSKLAMLTKLVVTLVNGLNGPVVTLLAVQERFLKGIETVLVQKALWPVAPTVAMVNSTKKLLAETKLHLAALTLNGAAGVNARRSATAVLTPGPESVDAKIGRVP